jgi:hypothetical protein
MEDSSRHVTSKIFSFPIWTQRMFYQSSPTPRWQEYVSRISRMINSRWQTPCPGLLCRLILNTTFQIFSSLWWQLVAKHLPATPLLHYLFVEFISERGGPLLQLPRCHQAASPFFGNRQWRLLIIKEDLVAIVIKDSLFELDSAHLLIESYITWFCKGGGT